MLKRLRQFLFTTLSLFVCYLLFATPISAQEEFFTRFTSSYTVSNEGVTTVVHQIELTNKLSNVYASEYSLSIGSTRIVNIVAASNSTSIQTTTTENENTTSIELKFKEPVVGKDQTLRFNVSYTNLDVATKNGRVLEVNIPRLANVNEIDDYNVIIKVPDMFDSPTVMTPPTASISRIDGQQVIRYTKKTLTAKGISILFGDHQVYDFTLRYTLKNPGITLGKVQIAIPPDTSYQKLYYDSITPPPENITVDPDGNWLAEFTVKPQQTLTILASGQAVLYLKPVSLSKPIKDASSLLTPQRFWPVDNLAIAQLGQKLATAENIYNYVVDNLTYDYSRIDASTRRLGAKSALDNPKNCICTEFTDLFITLARTAGIPARSINGFAFTNNSKIRPLSLIVDVLHAWPEYYDSQSQQWIPVDPTWGNTTKGIDYFSRWDLNHFTFSIQGQNSDTPLPAGAYKLDSTQGKDVNVAFSLNQPTERPEIDVRFHTPSISLPSKSQSIYVTVYNRGNTALHNTTIKAIAPGYNISQNQKIQLETLPPFASQQIKLTLTRNPLARPNNLLTIDIANQTFIHEIKPTNFSYPQALQALAALGLASVLGFAAYKTWRLLVQKPQK